MPSPISRRYRVSLEFAAFSASLAFMFAMYVVDRSLPQYVDESDNLLGGQLIARGAQLYVDYFSQHMPVPYYFAAIATLLGAHELTTYRVSFAILIALALGVAIMRLRRFLSSVFLFALVVSIGLGHAIFSGEMVLADHFFGLSLLVLLLLVLAWDGARPPSVAAQIVISVCCFCAVESTLISVYPLALLGAYYVVRQLLTARRLSRLAPSAPGFAWRTEASFGAIVLLPHLALVAVMVQQGALGSLIDQAVLFNQRYYSHYDIGGDPLSILRSSLMEFVALIARYLRPSGLREVETVLLVSNFAAVGLLWRKRGRLLAVCFACLVVLSRMRGPGYHGSPYFLVSFASMALVLAYAVDLAVPLVQDALRHGARLRRAAGRSGHVPLGKRAMVVLLGLYVASAALFVHDLAGFDRRLPRGQGLESPYVPVVLAATEPGDRIWAAPNEPYVYLVTGRMPASRYTYYQPWLSDSSTIQAAIVSDLQTVQPRLIVYVADKQIEWNFPLPAPAEYGGSVYAYIQQAYVQMDAQDPVLKNVYLRRTEASTRE